MHSKAMWPMHGKYICPDCLREFPVIWEDVPSQSQAVSQPEETVEWSKPVVHQWMGWLKRFGTM
jgi:hypothetical protein